MVSIIDFPPQFDQRSNNISNTRKIVKFVHQRSSGEIRNAPFSTCDLSEELSIQSSEVSTFIWSSSLRIIITICTPHTSFRHTFTTLLSVSKVEEIAWKEEANIKRRFPWKIMKCPSYKLLIFASNVFPSHRRLLHSVLLCTEEVPKKDILQQCYVLCRCRKQQ